MDFEDFVVFQVTEGGAESLSFVQGVFVDTKIEGAVQADAFTGFAYGKLLIDPANSGLTDRLVATEGAGADTVVMLLINMIAERLRALPVRPDT